MIIYVFFLTCTQSSLELYINTIKELFPILIKILTSPTLIAFVAGLLAYYQFSRKIISSEKSRQLKSISDQIIKIIELNITFNAKIQLFSTNKDDKKTLFEIIEIKRKVNFYLAHLSILEKDFLLSNSFDLIFIMFRSKRSENKIKSKIHQEYSLLLVEFQDSISNSEENILNPDNQYFTDEETALTPKNLQPNKTEEKIIKSSIQCIEKTQYAGFKIIVFLEKQIKR